MQSREKYLLNWGNSAAYLAGRLGNGLRAIPGSPFRLLLAALYWLVAALMIHAAASDNIVARLFQPLFWILAGLLFLTVVTATAIPPGTLRMANACRRIGLVNDCGEAPLLIKRYNKEDKTMIDFVHTGDFPVYDSGQFAGAGGRYKLPRCPRGAGAEPEYHPPDPGPR